MPDLKSLRKRIGSVKNTQKITRAMKMVAAARLNRAQQRITSMRPYAVRVRSVLQEVVTSADAQMEGGEHGGEVDHPLLARRPEKSTLILVMSGDRGLSGPFNSSVNKAAERAWRDRAAAGQNVQLYLIGRKGREYFKRRGAPIASYLEGVWDDLGPDQARAIAQQIIKPFRAGKVDSIYIVYNEFKSAMTQRVVVEPMFPLSQAMRGEDEGKTDAADGHAATFSFEPSKDALLERLVPMYVEITILRALYESRASFFGAQMTAMDSATKNASDLIDKLTLFYNRARQAAITTEIMEIIGGAEALNG
ncbi:MAG TPA: ATP synthase F1 subunit gamma [Polyangiaceae bacterium]|nr:ATP synthase F1 subunit gamma [Polyangiaceae bacterium]